MRIRIGVNEWCAGTNKPCAMNRYEFFQKFLLVGKVTETACERFDNHTVYFLADNAAFKPFEVWPGCVGSGQSIVGKHVHNGIGARLKIAVHKIAQDLLLIDDALAFVLIVILSG